MTMSDPKMAAARPFTKRSMRGLLGGGRRLEGPAFDAIRERLFSLTSSHQKSEGALVVEVASRTPREGVTSTLLGLAASIGRLGTLRTLLISYDTGPRGAGSRLGLDSPVARDPAMLASSVRTADGAGFDVLTLSTSMPSGFAGDGEWSAAFGDLSSQFHVVLVDAGALSEPLAARWRRIADLFVLVIDTTRTTQEELGRLNLEMQAGGRAIDAAILTKRRYRVPAFLYRYVA